MCVNGRRFSRPVSGLGRPLVDLQQFRPQPYRGPLRDHLHRSNVLAWKRMTLSPVGERVVPKVFRTTTDHAPESLLDACSGRFGT